MRCCCIAVDHWYYTQHLESFIQSYFHILRACGKISLKDKAPNKPPPASADCQPPTQPTAAIAAPLACHRATPVAPNGCRAFVAVVRKSISPPRHPHRSQSPNCKDYDDHSPPRTHCTHGASKRYMRENVCENVRVLARPSYDRTQRNALIRTYAKILDQFSDMVIIEYQNHALHADLSAPHRYFTPRVLITRVSCGCRQIRVFLGRTAV